MQSVDVLLLPGLGNSGPDHWQSHWEKAHGYHRVEQHEWHKPWLPDWLHELERTVAKSTAADRNVVLVAHSLACALVAHYGLKRPRNVLGAFLVSPADVDSSDCTPDEVRNFSPMPLVALPFPALVINSSNDPYVCHQRAALFADKWGADFEDIGPAGHINASSNLGAWPEGHARFEDAVAEWISPISA